MHPHTIRQLDYWVGVPLCFLLTLTRVVRAGGRRPVRSILFLKFIEQGATVLAEHALERAIGWVGRENVFFCVFESNRAILEVLDIVPSANVIVIRDRHLLTCLLDFLGALRRIRAKRIDAVIDMEFFSRASAIFAFLTGASTRVGLHRFTSELPYRGNLMTHRVQYNPYLHVSDQYTSLVDAARLEPSDEPMVKAPVAEAPGSRKVFTPTDEERRLMRERLKPRASHSTSSNEPRPIVVLNPNASDLLPLRKWPSSRFVELGQRVVAEHPAALIVITGASSEQLAADALCEAIASPRAVSLAGRTTLRELLTLYALSDVLVTNDSGPGHFASLTSVRTVVLFGPETPRLFGPRSSSSTVIWKNLACSPCVSVFNHRLSPCTDNVCMQLITVDEVYAAVASTLAVAPPS
ncbi:MAG: glycosyltransferase family 9 protein [Vicinamibacterales bacterium]